MKCSRQELDGLVDQYKDMVWRIALSVSKNDEDARDIFQDVFLALVKSIGKIENEAHLKHWLIRATVNRGYSLSKLAWKKRVDSYEKLHDDYGDLIEPGYEEDFSPKDREKGYHPDQAETEKGRQLMEAFLRLKREYRTVINLFYYEELSVKEVAAILGQKENAVKTRLCRAREALRKEMEHDAR